MTSKTGGEGPIRVVLIGDGDLTDVMLARSEGGGKHDLGLAERVKRKSDGRIGLELQLRVRASMLELADSLTPESKPQEISADIAILSINPDVFMDDESHNPKFLASAALVVEALQGANIHVLFLNASTFDPRQSSSNYHVIAEPFTRKAQRLDLDLLKLSISHGISIIDADRLLGELGALEHVTGPLDYSASACEALCDEALRIIDDYGFFENRPVMDQVGQRAR